MNYELFGISQLPSSEIRKCQVISKISHASTMWSKTFVLMIRSISDQPVGLGLGFRLGFVDVLLILSYSEGCRNGFSKLECL